jgi:proteasome lid subunit RPN8/RPN11
MTFSIRRSMRGLALPKARLFCSPEVWRNGLLELRRRGAGRRESGAFLLGNIDHGRRQIRRLVYYDDLDPGSLDSGIVQLSGDAFPQVWDICAKERLTVVGDVHTHPGTGFPQQSYSDRTNPMIGQQGHVALIVPDFASSNVNANQIAIDEYQGAHRWIHHGGKKGKVFFHIGMWGDA